MNNRRLSREVALQMIFQWESQGFIKKKHETMLSNTLSDVAIRQLVHQLIIAFHPKPDAVDIEFVVELLRGFINFIREIDETVDTESTKWRLSRMDVIDRSILRIATFELLFMQKTPYKVIINEALELAKKYSGEQSVAFINGVLDAIKKKH